jgi:endonuclease-3
MILTDFGGVLPDNMEDLLKLKGVARKTANIVLGHGFNKPAGIAVDTHVIRLSHLLHLTAHNDPVKIEKDLMQIIPKKYWTKFSIWLQALGRTACKARRPDCNVCPIADLCPSAKAKK